MPDPVQPVVPEEVEPEPEGTDWDSDLPQAPGGPEMEFPPPDDLRALFGEGLALDVPNEFVGAKPIEYDDLGAEYRYDPDEEIETYEPDEEDEEESNQKPEEEEPVEEAFVQHLHPRDRVGRFIDTADMPKAPPGAPVAERVTQHGIDVDALVDSNPQHPHEPLFVYQARIVNHLAQDAKHEVIFRIRERYPPCSYIAEGAKRWREEHGLPEPKVNLREIPAPLQKGDKVARAFEMSPDMADDPRVKEAFADFKRQNDEMWEFATSPVEAGGLGITVDFSDREPYASAQAQADDLRNNRHLTTQRHLGGHHDSTMTEDEYNRFRAVHDIFGHAAVGGGFDRHGEYEAWLMHMTMYTGKGRDAMSSEYHGVNTALWGGDPGTPGTGKSVLLPTELILDPFDKDGNLIREALELPSRDDIGRLIQRLGLDSAFALKFERMPMHALSHKVEEGLWDPFLHPRSRVGRFRDVTNLHEPRPSPTETYHGIDFTKPRYEVPIDPDIAKIRTADEAAAKLQGYGFVTELSNDNITHPETFWPDLVQASKDAVTKFPQLVADPPLAIRMTSVMKREDWKNLSEKDYEDDTSGIYWGTTGADLERGERRDHHPWKGEPWMVMISNAPMDPKLAGPVDAQSTDLANDGDLSIAGGRVYGRMMHEFGHAVAGRTPLGGASNLENVESGGLREMWNALVGLYEEADINPDWVGGHISEYAAGSPNEGWAEMFATLNTPGMLANHYPAVVGERLEKLRSLANAKYGHVL